MLTLFRTPVSATTLTLKPPGRCPISASHFSKKKKKKHRQPPQAVKATVVISAVPLRNPLAAQMAKPECKRTNRKRTPRGFGRDQTQRKRSLHRVFRDPFGLVFASVGLGCVLLLKGHFRDMSVWRRFGLCFKGLSVCDHPDVTGMDKT